MFTFDVIAVSNRDMCGDFMGQLEKISKESIPIILREKNLTEPEYEMLARQVMTICPEVILHTFTDAAKRLGVKRIHLPIHLLRNNDLEKFDIIGASVHSAEEAVEAEKLGASYVTAGHIFATDCKKGVPPRGLDFLKCVCDSVTIPVCAIGGITPHRVRSVIDTGAAGVCVMSGLMRCDDVGEYLNSIRRMK